MKRILKVPHIEIQKRSFVLEPMNEISPDKIHPVFKKDCKSVVIGFKCLWYVD